jgi:hypothetical protein
MEGDVCDWTVSRKNALGSFNQVSGVVATKQSLFD